MYWTFILACTVRKHVVFNRYKWHFGVCGDGGADNVSVGAIVVGAVVVGAVVVGAVVVSAIVVDAVGGGGGMLSLKSIP